MRVMIDIGHPAHVHYFRSLIEILEEEGHDTLVTSRDKDIAVELLEYYGIPFHNRGRGGEGALGKILYLLKADIWMLRVARAFSPDVLVGFSSPYPAHVARLLGKPYVALTDTEHSREQQRLFLPFCAHVLTPSCFKGSLGPKQVRFDSYMEMAYLSPSRFVPDPAVVRQLGLRAEDPYTIVRFVGWGASHDRGHTGLSDAHKTLAVRELERFGPVFISSERPLPPALSDRRCPLPVHLIHHAIAYARLVYGESATMASEAAVLGTHAVYHDDVGRGYTDEQEARYGLVARFSEDEEGGRLGLDHARAVLADPASKDRARAAATRIHAEKIDTTAFLHSFLREVHARHRARMPSRLTAPRRSHSS